MGRRSISTRVILLTRVSDKIAGVIVRTSSPIRGVKPATRGVEKEGTLKKKDRYPLGWLIPAGVVAGLVVGGAQSRGYGRELLPTSAFLVEEGPGWGVLVSRPDPGTGRWITAAMEQNPALAELASPLNPSEPQLYLLKGGSLTPLVAEVISLGGEDTYSGQHLQLDVLEVETPAGHRYLLDPNTSGYPVAQNTTRPERMIVEWGYLLWEADLEANTLEPLGNMDQYSQVQSTRVNHFDDSGHGNTLIWASAPTLSPDAKLVAFSTNRNGSRYPDVWVHDLSTHEEHLVWAATSPVRAVGWTPAGEILVQVFATPGEGASLWRIHPLTHQRTPVSRGEFMALSDDGNTVMMTENQGGVTLLKGVHLVDLSEITVWRSTPDENLRSWMGDFDPSGGFFATDLTRLDGAQHLKIFDLVTGDTRRVDLPPGQQLAGVAQLYGQGLVVPVENLKESKASTLWITFAEGN